MTKCCLMTENGGLFFSDHVGPSWTVPIWGGHFEGISLQNDKQ